MDLVLFIPYHHLYYEASRAFDLEMLHHTIGLAHGNLTSPVLRQPATQEEARG